MHLSPSASMFMGWRAASIFLLQCRSALRRSHRSALWWPTLMIASNHRYLVVTYSLRLTLRRTGDVMCCIVPINAVQSCYSFLNRK